MVTRRQSAAVADSCHGTPSTSAVGDSIAEGADTAVSPAAPCRSYQHARSDLHDGDDARGAGASLPTDAAPEGSGLCQWDGATNNIASSSPTCDIGDHTIAVSRQQHRQKTVGLWDYVDLLVRCERFRYFFVSATCMHVGDWFVQIASLLVVEQLADDSNRGVSLGNLVVWDMLPKPCFAPLGGILADAFDRKNLMIVLDTSSGIVTAGFLFALRRQSLTGIFVVTAMRSSLQSMYYPASTGIVPLLVSNPRDLQLAATMNAFAWSLMAIVGGILAGTASAKIGLQACYIVDSLTYFVSAAVVYFGIRGKSYAVVPAVSVEMDHGERFCPADGSSDHGKPEDTPSHGGTKYTGIVPTAATTDSWPAPLGDDSTRALHRRRYPCVVLQHTLAPVAALAMYLWHCGFGPNTLLKPSANAVWAPESIIGVAFSKLAKSETVGVGLVFSTLGLGCLVGPIVANYTGLTDATRPKTLQRAVVFAMSLSTLSWLAIALFADSFGTFIVLTFFRTMGSGIGWVNATLILQTLSDATFLGRVLAVEYAASNLVDAFIARWTGQLEDRGWDGNDLAWFGAAIGLSMSLVWGAYHYCFEAGAARDRFNIHSMQHDVDSQSYQYRRRRQQQRRVPPMSDMQLVANPAGDTTSNGGDTTVAFEGSVASRSVD